MDKKRIKDLANYTTPTGADVIAVDDVTANETKKLTLTNLKVWLQSLAGWISEAMLANGAVTKVKLADKAVTAPKVDFGGAGEGIWWEEVGRTTLGSPADIIMVDNIPARKYLKVLVYILKSGSTVELMSFNGSGGTAYNSNLSRNFTATPLASTGAPYISIISDGSDQTVFGTIQITNPSTDHKQIIGRLQRKGADGAVPDNSVFVGKWQSNAQVTRIDITNNLGGDYAAGSEVVVLGHD